VIVALFVASWGAATAFRLLPRRHPKKPQKEPQRFLPAAGKESGSFRTPPGTPTAVVHCGPRWRKPRSHARRPRRNLRYLLDDKSKSPRVFRPSAPFRSEAVRSPLQTDTPSSSVNPLRGNSETTLRRPSSLHSESHPNPPRSPTRRRPLLKPLGGKCETILTQPSIPQSLRVRRYEERRPQLSFGVPLDGTTIPTFSVLDFRTPEPRDHTSSTTGCTKVQKSNGFSAGASCMTAYARSFIHRPLAIKSRRPLLPLSLF
jgi:hypothetical protein